MRTVDTDQRPPRGSACSPGRMTGFEKTTREHGKGYGLEPGRLRDKEDIVLAWHPPHLRPYTDYAAA